METEDRHQGENTTLSEDAVSLSQQKAGGTTTYPPRMKSTKVYSDSALNDSSVTLTTFIRAERCVKCQLSVIVETQALTVPELMYFFLLPFFFGLRTFSGKSDRSL